MKALIVNLQDCEERRDAIKKQMEALRSIDYEFIDAVDGRKMNTQELNQLFNLTLIPQHFDLTLFISS